MKIIVNVDEQILADARKDWFECEGVRLVKATDGSFDLWLARDLAGARKLDEKDAEMRDFLAKISPGMAKDLEREG